MARQKANEHRVERMRQVQKNWYEQSRLGPIYVSSEVILYSIDDIVEMTGWRAEPMLSLGGVYAPSANRQQSKLPITLENATQNQTQINMIALHLDNDYAGRNASENILSQLRCNYAVRNEPPPYGKDCNDYLQHMIRHKHSRQMIRE